MITIKDMGTTEALIVSFVSVSKAWNKWRVTLMILLKWNWFQRRALFSMWKHYNCPWTRVMLLRRNVSRHILTSEKVQFSCFTRNIMTYGKLLQELQKNETYLLNSNNWLIIYDKQGEWKLFIDGAKKLYFNFIGFK